MMGKILLFIPMYNCQTQVVRVLEKLDGEIQGLFSEVLVVDNCSTDNGVEIARQALAALGHVRTRLVQNNSNYNLGGSIKVAFDYAVKNGFDYVVSLHGDDQGDIRDMVPVIKSGVHHDEDIVIGARFHKQSRLTGYSGVRTIGNKVLNTFYSLVSRERIDDMIAGLNVFKVSFLSGCPYLCFPNNLTFDAHLLLYAISQNKKIKFVPITWREEDQVSNAKVLRQAFVILKLLAKYCVCGQRLFTKMSGNEYSKILYGSRPVDIPKMKDGMRC